MVNANQIDEDSGDHWASTWCTFRRATRALDVRIILQIEHRDLCVSAPVG
jgi:hypothetical protein